MKITLRGEKAESWNSYWSGKHWSERSRKKHETQLLVRCNLPDDAEMYTVPVHVTITATYRRTPVDCDNVCSKGLIDAIKGIVVRDDNPQCIASVTTISRKGEQDSVTIEVTPVAD